MRATVVIPTLHGGDSLKRCVSALGAQTLQDFEVIVVDNSGRGVAREAIGEGSSRIVESGENLGFGAAINRGQAESTADYICALNDDAYPSEGWLEALVSAADADLHLGMCASLIVLESAPDAVDSAGLGVYRDGTTKQIGHREPASEFAAPRDALLPSGCAALYRRSMLIEIGGFDADYFLYGEDSDVGFRARLAGWGCRYVPEALVSHDYSGSAGQASRLKAFYVERNRVFTLVKLFPLGDIFLSPFFALGRYWAHWRTAARGDGLAGEFGKQENPLRLVLIVLQAHAAALAAAPRLWSQRRRFRSQKRLNNAQFRALLSQHRMTAREIARQ